RSHHAHPLAVARQPAFAAPRRDRRAEVLAEGHQQVVVDHPVAAGELAPQHLLALPGSLRPDVAPAIADAVDMDIHADPRLPKPEGPPQIGGLAAPRLARVRLAE